MEHIYILQLTCGKYFVGKSRDVEHTYAYYECGFGPKWIQTYNPVRILETHPVKSGTDVLDTTLALMKKHGLDSVRHYGCAEMRIPDYEEQAIRFLMHAPPDACVKCHATGHKAGECTQPENTSWACQWCVSDYPNRYACEQHEKGCRPPKEDPDAKDWCSRCGRLYHTADRCYEVKHAEGWWIR